MKKRIKKHYLLLKQSFICAIHDWAIIMHNRFNTNASESFEYAIEEILELSNEDFFQELLPETRAWLWKYIEKTPDKLRIELDKVFIEIAEKNYNYKYTAIQKYYAS